MTLLERNQIQYVVQPMDNVTAKAMSIRDSVMSASTTTTTYRRLDAKVRRTFCTKDLLYSFPCISMSALSFSLECDDCYKLVEAEVNLLREMQTNLTQYVAQLESQDNNTVLGPFHERLDATQAKMQTLIQFVSNSCTFTKFAVASFNYGPQIIYTLTLPVHRGVGVTDSTYLWSSTYTLNRVDAIEGPSR